MFAALACGIPLVSAPRDAAEGLVRPGQDYRIARDGTEMTRHLKTLAADPALVARAVETVRARHGCRHRALDMLEIVAVTPAALPEAAQ